MSPGRSPARLAGEFATTDTTRTAPSEAPGACDRAGATGANTKPSQAGCARAAAWRSLSSAARAGLSVGLAEPAAGASARSRASHFSRAAEARRLLGLAQGLPSRTAALEKCEALDLALAPAAGSARPTLKPALAALDSDRQAAARAQPAWLGFVFAPVAPARRKRLGAFPTERFAWCRSSRIHRPAAPGCGQATSCSAPLASRSPARIPCDQPW